MEAMVGQSSAPGHIGGKKPVGGKESVAWRGIRLLPVLRYSVIRLGAVPVAVIRSGRPCQQIPERNKAGRLGFSELNYHQSSRWFSLSVGCNVHRLLSRFLFPHQLFHASNDP